MSLGRLRLLGTMGQQEYWSKVHKRQTNLVRALKPYPGCFMQRDDWFGDVWGEVISVYAESVFLCDGSGVSITSFYSFRGRVEVTPPLDSRIIYVHTIAGLHNVSTRLSTDGLESATKQWRDFMTRKIMAA